MHRSEDRGFLGKPRDEIDAPAARTRRERRLQRADPATPQTDSPFGDWPPAVVETPLDDGEFSIAALFDDAPPDLPDLPPNILTVCTGNICRSPLAEAVLASRLADLDLRVHSAGTQALVGHGMPAEALELAALHGVPSARAGSHTARLLTESLMHDADLVLTMTSRHSTDAVQLAPRRLHRTFTVREFARLAATLDDDVLLDVAHGAPNARSRFNALVQAVSDQRGIALRADGDEDVIDPYRRSASVYAQSAEQLIPALAQVERVARLAMQG